jgi:hypothetical protein
MKFQLVLLSIVALLLQGCASVIKGQSQTVTFDSTPTGAEVILDGNSMGKTPVTLKLKKNKYETIMIKLKGYKTVTRPLDKSYDAVALLNIFWDLSTTDLISGAAYEYEPNSYNFTLEAEEGAAPAPAAPVETKKEAKTEKKS